MAGQRYRVVFTQSAWQDLEEIVAYWTEREEAERGKKYARDLSAEAVRQLGDAAVARGGRFLKRTAFPKAQELAVFKRSYRILYEVKDADGLVEVWRFWHSHRREPFQE